ncbi:MAG: class I adenylate-forming enzyme family protein [Panacagrimonas sp.]
MNLGRYSAYWARLRRDHPAVVFKGQALSWAELDRQADAVAAALQRMGVVRGDRVGCLLFNCVEWAVTYLATLKAGAMIVPLNARYGDEELRQIERQIEARVVVSQPALIRKLVPAGFAGEEGEQEVHLYALGSGRLAPLSWRAALAANVSPVMIEVEPTDGAAICFTSGSTGLPKGVVLTHQGIQAFALSQITAMKLTSDERVLLLAPFAFTGGVISVFTPAYVVGGCVYIEEGLDPARALQLLVSEKISSLTAVPILFDRLTDCVGFAQADLSALRTAITGGASVSETLLQIYVAKRVSIRQVYGCTEGCGLLALPTEDVALKKPWSCGWPMASVDIRLVNAHGEICAAGEPGEILIRGLQVMKGYWRNPEADQQAWKDGWYQTGDMGVFDEDGHLRIVDRKKNMVITGGVNVYPAEVERAIGEIPGIAEVLVFGRPDAQWGERVVAVVFGASPLDAAMLLKESRRRLGDYKAPREVLISPRPLPRTSSGKLPRHDLENLYASLAGCARATS